MSTSKNIFLLDSQINFSEINYSDDNDYQVITFDFDSHNDLKKKSVPHLISDTFLSKKEHLDIQKNAFLLSDWYKEETIKENIEYENVNLGSLIQAEFINILVNYSKRFLECLNIIRKFGTDKNYHCSGLTYEIMKCFSVKVEKINDSYDDSLFFPLDSLKIKMKLGIKNHSTELEISQNFFKKLKKLTEKSSIFLSKKSIESTQKNILISEFNTLSYESLFSKIPEFNLNFIFFNRRQPTVWNRKTFSTIKKSGVIVENDYTLMNNEIKNNIKNDKKNIEIKININPRATAISKFPFDVSNAIDVVITLVACAILPPTIIMAPTSDNDLPKPARMHVNNEYLESHKIVIILSLVFARKDFKSSSYSSVICSITCLVSETIIGVIKQN